MKTIIVMMLIVTAVTKTNLTITTRCTTCGVNTTEECFFLHGGPFDHFEIAVEDTVYSSCGNSSNDLSFPETATFSCGVDQSCTDNNCYLYQSDWQTFGECTGQYYASKTLDNLNYFYSLFVGDHTQKSYYPWCDNLCGPQEDTVPIWTIIVISVLGAIVVVGGIAIGVYCCRQRSERVLIATDAGGAQRLIK